MIRTGFRMAFVLLVLAVPPMALVAMWPENEWRGVVAILGGLGWGIYIGRAMPFSWALDR